MKKRVQRSKRPGGPAVRLPLPKKWEKRHGDATKYQRSREKERSRKEPWPAEIPQ